MPFTRNQMEIVSELMDNEVMRVPGDTVYNVTAAGPEVRAGSGGEWVMVR